MAITQTGSVTVLDNNSTPPISGGSASGSAAVTIPADAELMVISFSGYSSTDAHLSAAGVFDVAGNTSVGVASPPVNWRAAIHYIVSPATGSQNLDWQWGGGAGTVLSEAPVLITISYWKGIDTTSPLRSSSTNQGTGATITSGTVTAVTGDLLIAVAGVYDVGTTNPGFVWTGATQLAGPLNNSYNDTSLATASPTGNQSVTWAATDVDEGAIVVLVIKPTGAGGYTPGAGTLGVAGTSAALAYAILMPSEP